VPAPGVLANDSDADGDPLTAVLASGPAHGTLTLNPDGSFTYTPGANFAGTDVFTYKANDGTTDSNMATVSITVASGAGNHAPVAVNDAYSTLMNKALFVPAPGVLVNDTDADGDALTAIQLSGPTHGTLELNLDGSFTYTPDAHFTGSDSFTYKANDGSDDSNTANVSITVVASTGNHAPVAVHDSYSTPANTALVVAAPGVLANDTDADGDPLTAVLASGPAHGSLALNADGSFTYTPNSNFSGTDTFTYKANDGTTDSSAATVRIIVGSGTGNHAPVASDDSYATPPNTPLVIAAPGVLANDSDADGDSLTAVLAGGPAHGTLALNANGSFTYTPNAEFTGSDSFTYKASDGTTDSNVATVSIAVASAGGAPIVVHEDVGSVEVPVQLSAASTHPLIIPFTLSGTARRGADYTIAGNFIRIPAGSTSAFATVHIIDDHLSEADESIVIRFHEPRDASLAGPTTQTITIVDNDAPKLRAIPDRTVFVGATVRFNASVSNAPHAAPWLQFSLDGEVPAGASITPAGRFTWTPEAGQAPGDYTLSVRVSNINHPELFDVRTFHVVLRQRRVT
jgi:VCBS repeat-containing protein